MRSILIAAFLFVLILNACCSKPVVEQDIAITITEINCWLNLMPGGEPSFHYSGTFTVDRKFSDSFKFSAVKVFYKDEMLHQSQPLIQFYDETITDSTSLIKFNFYSQQGIKVTEKMMRAEIADFILVFEISGKTIEKSLKEIPITRAY